LTPTRPGLLRRPPIPANPALAHQRFAQFVHYNDRVMMIRFSSVFLSSL
jgi:hypothetical protein